MANEEYRNAYVESAKKAADDIEAMKSQSAVTIHKKMIAVMVGFGWAAILVLVFVPLAIWILLYAVWCAQFMGLE